MAEIRRQTSPQNFHCVISCSAFLAFFSCLAVKHQHSDICSFSLPLFPWLSTHTYNLLNCSCKIISNFCDQWLFHFCLCYFTHQWLCYTADIKCCPSMAASVCQVSILHCVIIPGSFVLIFRETKPKSLIHVGLSLTQGGNLWMRVTSSAKSFCSLLAFSYFTFQ